jgi:hypothetical protein
LEDSSLLDCLDVLLLVVDLLPIYCLLDNGHLNLRLLIQTLEGIVCQYGSERDLTWALDSFLELFFECVVGHYKLLNSS